MSIRIMSLVWDLDLPDSEKLVALALADWSDDAGRSWPSVAQIAKKCSKSERTVQAALINLEKRNILVRDMRPGKGCVYSLTPAAAAPLDPRSRCTPAAVAPPQPLHPTPAAVAGDPRSRCTQYVKDTPIYVTQSAREPEIEIKIESEPEPEPENEDRVSPDEVVDAWNETAGRFGLPLVRLPLSPERKRKLAARIREHPPNDWQLAFAAIERSPFLRGEQGTWRGATFDFLLQPSSFTKMIEGNYDRPG